MKLNIIYICVCMCVCVCECVCVCVCLCVCVCVCVCVRGGEVLNFQVAPVPSTKGNPESSPSNMRCSWT